MPRRFADGHERDNPATKSELHNKASTAVSINRNYSAYFTKGTLSHNLAITIAAMQSLQDCASAGRRC